MKSNWIKMSLCGLVLLTGCGQEANNNTSSSVDEKTSSGYIKEKTEIKVLTMITESNSASFENLIESFEETEPNVNVVPIYISGGTDYDSLQRQAIVGFFKDDYPDVIQCYPDHVVNYLRLGKALNVQPYLDDPVYGLSAEDQEDYIDTFMNEGRQFEEKGTYSLPFCKSTEVMYYNKNLVLNADLTAFRATLSDELQAQYTTTTVTEDYLNSITWEEFFQYLAPGMKYLYGDQLTENGTTDATILSYKSTDNFFITLATEYGGYTTVDEDGKGVLLFDNDNMREKVTSINSYISHYPTLADGSAFVPSTYKCSLFDSEKLENHYNFAKKAFSKGKALFAITSNASILSNIPSNEAFEVGVASIPSAKGKEQMAISQGTPITILDHQDDNRSLASYLFWKHITNKVNSSNWSLQSGYIGIRNSNYDIESPDIAGLDKSSLTYRVYMDQYHKFKDMSDEMFQTKTFRGSSTCREVAGQLFLSLLNQETLTDEIIDERFANAIASINKYL
jgi:multiple sugar transport system substrate-binding protein